MMSVIGRRPQSLTNGFDYARRLGTLFQSVGMPFEEFARDRGEAVQLSPPCIGPLTGFLDLGIDSAPNQLEPLVLRVIQ